MVENIAKTNKENLTENHFLKGWGLNKHLKNLVQ